ncbi:MAG: bifunctional riboflavin kinase/FAD synthetase [Saprospiraceae bacterium]|nr:bifunctional riboflavin kinase/FAD synthetase [Saprospiraceae bacterium]
MNIYRDLVSLPSFRNAVLTIGSFDGVHIGHQQLIKHLCQRAKEENGQSILITFYPHPRLVVSQSKVKLLNTLEEKAQLLAQYGVEELVVVPFTKAFAEQSADEYIEQFLVRYFQPKCIIIGYDHKYGKGRTGDINYLKKLADKHQYRVEEISKQEVSDIAVSSTKVRRAIQAGQVAKAAQLLGHPFVLSGTVVRGQQIGSKIGFPTANIHVTDPNKIIPPEGIYAVQVIHQANRYKGMLYIGSRPTVDQNLEKTIEVNIFNFDRAIYEQDLQVEFIQYLRGDIKFDTLDELKAQLYQDKQAALAAL